MDDLELGLTRFSSIRLDFNQIVQIFSDIFPGKNEKTKNVDDLELVLTRFGSIKLDFTTIV